MTAVAPGVILLTRSESGLTTSPGGDPGAAQTRLRVHHGASKNVTGLDAARAVWREYRRMHVEDNGWSDIGYSFGVARGDDPERAYILTGRGWGRWGAHTLGHNDDLGACFLGNGADPAVITPGVKRAYSWLRSARADGPRPVFGHRDTSQTACPGDALYSWAKAGMPLTPGDDMPLSNDDVEKVAKRTAEIILDDRMAAFVDRVRRGLDGELGDESGAGEFSTRIAEKVAARVPSGGMDVGVLARAIAAEFAARLARPAP